MTRYALGADIGIKASVPGLGSLRVTGEFVLAQNLDRALVPADPIALGRGLRELGYAIAVCQELTPYVELGVRYDVYDPDADAHDSRGPRLVPYDASFSTWAFVVSLRSFENAQLSLEYDHNRNPLGRAASGQPTTLGSDVLIARTQWGFECASGSRC